MRKSISVTFFSMVATLLVLGTAVMGFSEWVLFNRYFAQERYETLDSVAEVTQRAADYVVQQAALPGGDELDALSDKLVIIGESAEAYLFFTDEDGSVLITSNPELLAKETVPEELIANVGEDKPYHVLSTLDGVLTEKSYVSVRQTRDAQGVCSGYLFLCSSGARLTAFKEEFGSNFFFSACIMLLCASVVTSFLMRRLTDPLQKITDAAQRFGGGDFSVRVEGVDGEGEVADLARTFNQMADNIQSNDNSRGQFMGNIAHELRTPLAILQTKLELFAEEHPAMDAETAGLVSSLREQLDRLTALVRTLLEMSNLQSVSRTDQIALAPLVEEILTDLTPLAQKNNISLQQDCAELGMVGSDALIYRLVFNLVENGIKYNRPGGAVCVTLRQEKQTAVLRVADTGPGIPAD